MFDWKDSLLLRDQLTEEERLIQDAVQRMASWNNTSCHGIFIIYMYDEKNVSDSFFVNRILAANRNEVFDKEIMTELGSQGFLAGPYFERLQLRWRGLRSLWTYRQCHWYVLTHLCLNRRSHILAYYIHIYIYIHTYIHT